MTIINQALLDEVSAEARAAGRLRKNRNFHPADDFPAHRLLNAIEPGSYVPPHRHLDKLKDETMVALRGRIGIVYFDSDGQVTETVVLSPDGDAVGIDITHGTYHSVLGLTPGSVFLEAKAGPYAPLLPEEKAAWAPVEGEVTAAAYLARLQALFES